MKTISINTGRPYRIYAGAGTLTHFAEYFREVYRERKPKLAIITDDIVDGFYGEALEKQLRCAGYESCKFMFANGESAKHLGTVNDVYAFLAANSITRTDVIIALGGGVVGDLAGFAAATWLRGIDFVQIPTTLLAMIDSSVGGKTGVDTPQGKNLVGSFWQPTLVVCDTHTLETLPDEVFSDGTAEAIKYGAIMDANLFTLLETGNLRDSLEAVICRCIELKKLVVEEDERDKDMRQILNFGHTFGHAIERNANFTITHGKGVAIGMVLITRACEQAGVTPDGTADRISACCKRYGLPAENTAPLEVLCEYCMGDKKRSGSKITLITLDAIGKAALYPIEAERLLSFIKGDCHA